MLRRLRLAAATFLASATLAAGPLPAQPLPFDAEMASLVRARLDAAGRGSAQDWAGYVADECLCGSETKAQIQHAIATRLPTVKNWYGEIRDLQVLPLGDAAVARYRVTEYTEVAGQRTSIDLTRTETYVKRAGRWLLIAGADVVIPPDPAVAAVDLALFDSYVGRYQYTPGSIDTVTREGNRLFVQPTGEARVEIFPENETTFFAKGEPWRLVFVRNVKGPATSVIFRQQGQDFVGTRLP